ncbi:hypothetical protein GQ457_02G032650 [Hibiscus cannabinus]
MKLWDADRREERSPGPDGFNMRFLKKFWPDLKDEILVLKPSGVEEYIPISLVGCVYKLLSKVLARRLSKVLNEVIGDFQFAFCPGKQLLDCSLIANEVIVFTRKKGWIFMCISSAYISVLVNGSPTAPFAIGRGLRQGCPLPPFLFNIIAEALSAIIQKANSKGLFKGFQVGRGIEEFEGYLGSYNIIIWWTVDTDKLIARFLWGSGDNKGIHWVSWENIVLPKSYGGLGLINFKIKNRALLNKWLWRFGTETNSLWRKDFCEDASVARLM